MENKKNKRKKWLSNQLKTKYQTNRGSIIEIFLKMKKLKNRNYTNNEIKTCQMKIEKEKKSKYNKLKLLL